jgi:tetratricopeptide (TPR) repeat protein
MGYSKEYFFKKMETGMSDLTTITEKHKRFAEKPDAKTAAMLAEYSASKAEYKDAIAMYSRAAEMDEDNDFAYELYENYSRGMRRDLFSMQELMAAADAALSSENTDAESKYYVLYGMSSYATKMPDDEKIIGYLKEANVLAQEKLKEGPDRGATNITINYTLVIEKDADKAISLKKETMPEGWEDDAGSLNEFSWWCFENNINLEEAEKYARRGVKLAKPGREKAMILDTCAEIVFINGKSEEAIALIKEAMKEDPNSEYYPQQLKKFQG